MTALSFGTLAALMPVLLWAAWTDFTRLRIGNDAVLAALLLFLCATPFLGLAETALRLGPAAACFGIGLVLFALGITGGGDVKFLSAVMLFVPPGTIALFLLEFTAGLAVCIAVVEAMRRLPAVASGSSLAFLGERGSLPVAPAIAIACALHLVVLARIVAV